MLSPAALIEEEMSILEKEGTGKERLPNCQLILPNHIALDQAREKNVVMLKLARLVAVLDLRMKTRLHVVPSALLT